MDDQNENRGRDLPLDVYWILLLAVVLAGWVVYRAMLWELPAA